MEVSRVWIVDVDGTLVDSRGAHLGSCGDALAEQGISACSIPAEVLDRHPSEAILGMASRPLEGRQIAHLLRRKRDFYSVACQAGLPPTPGARELLAALRSDGVRVIATGLASPQETVSTLQAAGLLPWVDEVLDIPEEAWDPPQWKLLRALAGTGSPQSRALFLGDSPRDVRAAAGAGIPMLALRCGGYGERALAGAAGIYDNPAELLAVLTADLGPRELGAGTSAGIATLP